jgi:hypothetical protein
MKLDRKEVANVVFKLYLYSDVCKMIHYSTKKIHEHKQADEIRDTIMDFADKLAEQSFGFTGLPNFNDFSLKLSVKKTKDLSQLCQNVFSLISNFEEKIKNNKYSGIISLIDDFKGKLSNLVYLNMFDKVSDKILNETINNSIKKILNEK